MSREVTDDVHLLEVGWPEPLGANAYLIDDGAVTLVDAGLPVGRNGLPAEIADAGYDVAALDRILLTHYDVDHVGGLRAIDAEVPVYLGSGDVSLVGREWAPPLTHPKGAYHRLLRRVYSLSGRDLRPVLNGEHIGGFRAIHTPGHNPGHTVFLHDDLRVTLLGDLVSESGGAFRIPPWLDSYDPHRVRESIDRVATETFEYGCVGHGAPVGPDADARLADLATGH